MTQDKLDIRQALVQQLESLERAGVMQLAKAKPKARRAKPSTKATETPPTKSKQPEAKVAASSSNKTAPPTAAPPKAASKSVQPRSNKKLSKDSVVQELKVLSTEVAGCTQCKELASTRTQTVFGVGNPQPRLCFLGEAPGADEDKQGEPFVGRAGQLLNKIIEACHMQREDVYILNILKCRPPGNRTPLPNEAANCRGFLNQQLDLLRPEFICCLGACAAQNLLQTDVSIGKLRGKLHELDGIQVLCTYHPAYLLRNPDAKKLVWEDMKLLMREMGTPVD